MQMKKKHNHQSLSEMQNRLKKEYSLKDLSSRENPLVQGSLNTKVTDLITDSRRVTPGSAFFAIQGLRNDGHDFVDEAIHRGAKTIISKNIDDELPMGITAIKSENPRLALAKFAKKSKTDIMTLRIWV